MSEFTCRCTCQYSCRPHSTVYSSSLRASKRCQHVQGRPLGSLTTRSEGFSEELPGWVLVNTFLTLPLITQHRKTLVDIYPEKTITVRLVHLLPYIGIARYYGVCLGLSLFAYGFRLSFDVYSSIVLRPLLLRPRPLHKMLISRIPQSDHYHRLACRLRTPVCIRTNHRSC